MLCYSTIRINKILEYFKNYVVAVAFFCLYMCTCVSIHRYMCATVFSMKAIFSH